MSEETPTDIRKQLEDFWRERLKANNREVCPDCFKSWIDTMVEHVFDWIDLDGEIQQILEDDFSLEVIDDFSPVQTIEDTEFTSERIKMDEKEKKLYENLIMFIENGDIKPYTIYNTLEEHVEHLCRGMDEDCDLCEAYERLKEVIEND